MNKIIAIITAGLLSLAALSYARADERVCAASMKDVIAQNQQMFPDFDVKDAPPELKSLINEKLGTPPVEEPYDIGIAVATVNDEKTAMLIIHEGDCALLSSRTWPLRQFLNFLGVTEANG